MEEQINQIIKILEEINHSLNSFDPQWLIVIISFFTLILLFFYTYYTRKIAKATEEAMLENLRPIVSCVLKSGRNYYSAQQLQQNPELKNDTRCIVSNHSKYNVEVFVNLNLKLDDQSKEISEEYAGKKGWALTSFQTINGHFDLSKKFNLEKIKNVTIDLEVNYKSDVGKLYKNPIQRWRFDKEKEVWVNDIGAIV